MLFSILIPVYNVENYLRLCIDSVLKQGGNDFEIILIDDGSTDGSGKICDEYSHKYPNLIRTIHQKNQGLLLARRKAFQLARGEYCFCCDSDDMLKSDALMVLRKEIEKSNADMIIFNVDAIKGDTIEKFTNGIFTKATRRVITNKEDIYVKFLTTFNINGMWCKVFKRDIVDIFVDYQKFAHISNGEDTLQSIVLFNNAQNIVYINTSLYSYRVNVSGMTKIFNRNYAFAFAEINEIVAEKMKNIDFPNKAEYITLHLMIAVYLALTQMKFKTCSFTYSKKVSYIREILNNQYIRGRLQDYTNINKKLKKHLNKRQRLILYLLSHSKVNAIVFILTIWRNIGILLRK